MGTLHKTDYSLPQDELKLEEERNRRRELEAALNACQEGIYLCDSELRCLWVNPAYQRVTGIPASKLLGKTSYQLEEEGIISQSVGKLVLDKMEEVSLIQTFQGSGKKVLVTGKPVFDSDGSLFRIVITARDVTELNRLENKLRDTQEKSEQYVRELSSQLKRLQFSQNIVAVSSSMVHILETIPRIAQVDSPVLIQGESGTGKEVLSKLIHDTSQRESQPFIKINCGAIPGDLLESELFGYVKGAFTGADQKGKPGLIEIAHNGTLFLDEIGEMPPNLQVKFLRVLQDFEVRRLGSTSPKKVNVRVICATNRPLQKLVEKGEFREDLYYRINVIPIHIPPLRERREDIEPLIRQMMKKLTEKYGFDKKLSLEALYELEQYHWPGNVRELHNLIERLYIMTSEDVIEARHLPPHIRSERERYKTKTRQTLKSRLQRVEQDIIRDVLKQSCSLRQAAAKLGVDPSTLSRKCRKYGIELTELS
ncbi:MAG: sigma 54-interacting transcriptional regulator [Bacillaceae bacterium]|nr:sigma 54-interacting transcriptional regulator [Bacillaceae bacterium]